MNIRKEIELHADKDDKPILYWLLGKYHMYSEWRFLVKSKWYSYGPSSVQSYRVWYPSIEGRILYKYRKEVEKQCTTELLEAGYLAKPVYYRTERNI